MADILRRMGGCNPIQNLFEDPAHNTPRHFFVNELIEGWSTALMQMSKGDNWIIYIPSTLGYGAQKKSDIPAYSTLIFDLNLVDFSEL